MFYSVLKNLKGKCGFVARKRSIRITHHDSGTTATFLAAGDIFSNIHSNSVLSLDVTTGGLGVSACSQDKLIVWETSTGQVRRMLEGHVSSIYTCRFFPSGIVVLTGGADMQIKIWSAETGQCAATLTGHTGGITGTAIVDRGRNMVSSSRDGTARLWDVGMSACLDTIANCGCMINCCAVHVVDNAIDLGEPDKCPSDREVMTEGVLLLLACEDGTLQGYGLQSRKKLFEVTCTGAVNTCAFLSSTEVICGLQNGQLYRYDIRNISSPLQHWGESRGPILCVVPFHNGILLSTGDGSCLYRDVTKAESTLEFSGSDGDAIHQVAHAGRTVYTACRDGCIRKFSIPQNLL
ncbi:PREDICTED: proteasomal ATPase-associated factor 1-like isoform X2 [Priapulus caudatus]|uniref:Proteasomal ATPase-associated factor 1-like isoform X2 n=1 Tax=Priapulus caudatus TaxID=37621 RepID=A0ABM1ERE2_PRICU|nr:PREDICTED: proteasomal ATPase-associated factor 1-like isoform X2 [Priapulus caudatus]